MADADLADPGSITELATLWSRATVEGLRRRRVWKDVEGFCLFVGYPRSGHTLIGSLLNAHPEIVVAHELDVLRFVNWGMRRDQLFSLLLQRDREFTSLGSHWSGYDYAVPAQHQGRFSRLRVIGDKRAASATNRLADNPDLLGRLVRTVGVPVHIIHVVRNPFDNIATMARRRQADLAYLIERYSRLGATVEGIRDGVPPDRFLDVRYEDFVDRPQDVLGELCRFLGVEASDDYLRDCAAVVHSGPSRSREACAWQSHERSSVESLIARRPVLTGYTFAGEH
jgi:hypothetical protein